MLYDPIQLLKQPNSYQELMELQDGKTDVDQGNMIDDRITEIKYLTLRKEDSSIIGAENRWAELVRMGFFCRTTALFISRSALQTDRVLTALY